MVRRIGSWNVSESQISEELFYEALQRCGLRSRYAEPPPAFRLRDATYDRIAHLLDESGRSKWKKLKRTFVVLHQCRLEGFMEAFIGSKREDVHLPYTEDSLPDALTGEDRTRFLRAQEHVLTSQGARIESPGWKHLHLKSSAEKFFTFKAVLGRGFFSTVEHVESRFTDKSYALKRIPRHHFDEEKDQMYLVTFQNELSALQGLSHKHMIKLVGSYTDPEYVGLLMKPVADKNLKTFLQEKPDNPGERRLRLRGFFGCIATAINYLHNNESAKVQHKDIKPANILVRGSTVLIADFGSARNRPAGATETTEPTAVTHHFMTPRYAPPEAHGGNRTYASDIWSLGCVFLEMLTVLAGITVSELDAFFKRTVDDANPYWRNQSAIGAWLDRLSLLLAQSDTPADEQLIGIIRAMCLQESSKRVNARDLVRRLFKLHPPYYGICCTIPAGHEGPSIETRMESDSSDGSEGEPGAGDEEEFDIYPSIEEIRARNLQRETLAARYLPPSVEDDGTITLTSKNEPPRRGPHVLEDVTVVNAPHLDHKETSQRLPTESSPSASDLLVRNDGLHSNEDAMKEQDQSLCNLDKPAVRSMPDSAYALESLSIPGLPAGAVACSWPGCKPPKGVAFQLFDGFASLQEHLRNNHHTHEFGLSSLLDEGRASRPRAPTLNPKTGAMEILGTNRQKPSSDERTVRFAELPTENRPKPALAERKRQRNVTSTNLGYSIHAELPEDPTSTKSAQMSLTKQGLPATTFAPSYLLAAKNRFAQRELLIYKAKSVRPLFVYGTLMFPSVIRRQSERFMGAEGTYSSKQGRRLTTTSSDWHGVNTSIQAAAECMTPAVLQGYRRFTLPRYSIAYAQNTPIETDAEIRGFLIFGLSSEALACLDQLYEDGGPRYLFDEKISKNRTWRKTRLIRKNVTVKINVAGGDTSDVDAEVFVIDAENVSVPEDPEDWNMDMFLRSRSFNQLTNSLDGGSRIPEEESIARTIGSSMVLPGDSLAVVASNGNQSGLNKLLDEGYDVDAPSVKFGTALQAAAARGKLDMMKQLLAANASVDASGGQYGNSLIAAVVEDHMPAVQLLLQHNARLFTPGGKYISALYQAVEFDRIKMAHALLEKGAWLTKDYRELLDLATERNNDAMYQELLKYDVRGLQKRDRSPTPDSKSKADQMQSKSSIGAVCMFEAIKLHNQPGKWTGIKGVQILRAGIERAEGGLDEDLIEKIRPHIHSFPAMQKFFSDAVGETFGGRLQPVKHTNPDAEEVLPGIDWRKLGRSPE